MNSQKELSQQELLFNLIKWTNKTLLSKYHGVFKNYPNVREELDVIVGMMNLAVNEINRLTNEE